MNNKTSRIKIFFSTFGSSPKRKFRLHANFLNSALYVLVEQEIMREKKLFSAEKLSLT